MLATLNMPESLRLSLKYNGPNVDDGTMPIGDVVDALQGFSGAYGRIASLVDSDKEHELRVTAVRTGSFELLVVAWVVSVVASGEIESLKPIVDSARWVYSLLKGVVSAKKHTRGRPYDFSVKGDNNTVVIFNADGAQLSVPPEVFEIFKSKIIDSNLNKIAAPLSPDRIDSAEISIENDPEPIFITAGERDAFASQLAAGSKIDTELIGRFVSLNKERDNGTFKMGNERNVRYRYIGDSPEKMHSDFSYEGPVRVKCMAILDENLEVDFLEIKSVERLQPSSGSSFALDWWRADMV